MMMYIKWWKETKYKTRNILEWLCRKKEEKKKRLFLTEHLHTTICFMSNVTSIENEMNVLQSNMLWTCTFLLSCKHLQTHVLISWHSQNWMLLDCVCSFCGYKKRSLARWFLFAALFFFDMKPNWCLKDTCYLIRKCYGYKNEYVYVYVVAWAQRFLWLALLKAKGKCKICFLISSIVWLLEKFQLCGC